MKSTLYKSLFVCALVALSLNTFAQGNHSFTGNTLYDPYGRCQLYFPGEPAYQPTDVPSKEMGNLKMYQFMYTSADGTLIYMLAYVDYPTDKMVNRDTKSLLQTAADSFIGALKLTSRSQSFINYGNYTGIMFLADNGSYYTSMRDFMVDNRLYQIGILKVGAEVSVQIENEYFDSFVLTK